MSGKLPERRSNHCSFIVNDYLYIHGGRDIKEGPMSSMWKLSVSAIEELMEDSEYGVSWTPVTCTGANQPGRISHHKPVVFGSSVVIFGGLSGMKEINEAYEFDSIKSSWN